MKISPCNPEWNFHKISVPPWKQTEAVIAAVVFAPNTLKNTHRLQNGSITTLAYMHTLTPQASQHSQTFSSQQCYGVANWT